MATFVDSFRTWRRRLKARMPFVRRREYHVVQRNYAQLIDALDGAASPAAQARLHVAKPLVQPLAGEVCLFVSFAAEPDIKPHVTRHVSHLLDAGIRVVLIFNTDLQPARLAVDPALRERLSGVFVRENIGYDFGAWSQVLALCGDTAGWTRLFLVNDSIVGPLDPRGFERLIARVRGSAADVVGLTEALAPARHLQSYFLVLNPRALNHPALRRLFDRVLNWPSKSQVIDVYESRLTALAEAQGLRCEALFPSLSGDPLSSDDTSLRWDALVRSGFPYLKTRVIDNHPDDPRIRALLGPCP